jgi:hypothetical protein
MTETLATNQAIITSLFQLLTQIPTLLVLIAGIVVFLLMLRRSPTACALSAGSFALLLAGRIARPFVTNALMMKQRQMGWAVATLAQFLNAWGLAFGLLEAAAFGMLIGAVLVGRTGKDAPASGQ